ncbi:GPR1/FUN34/yaaH family protein [Trypanosoma rangeli]|uniref:GPR1/FUN34/yaaH family protein n=1 Tax=Trypanosoma rangeli TaxID=5698 RepID=A0A3R7KQK3_TRYRA|nr:GPR1/FUN34/yaaH family protein [Trypanosoma rangeli]RNF07741.1 GPR1/FUN34/yaaH family protein [Trypanosoma rangeli]|eukprot:RNF07741.1 GPR1/FUN34/yaaH family protein [Trypanosoma rangeli]
MSGGHGVGLANQLLATLNTNEEKTMFLEAILQNILSSHDLEVVRKTRQPKKRVNPAPQGLLGFGMSTILASAHNADLFELSSVVPAMGLVMGGGMQLLVGLLEYFNGNAFAATSFMCYGAFWLSLVGVWLLPQTENDVHVMKTVETFMGLYLLLWGLFTICMASVTFFSSHRMVQFLMSSLALGIFLLSAGEFSRCKIVKQAGGMWDLFLD